MEQPSLSQLLLSQPSAEVVTLGLLIKRMSEECGFTPNAVMIDGRVIELGSEEYFQTVNDAEIIIF